MDLIFIVLSSGAASLVLALILALKILNRKVDDENMLRIHKAIKEGAKAYLHRQFKTITPFIVCLLYTSPSPRDRG